MATTLAAGRAALYAVRHSRAQQLSTAGKSKCTQRHGQAAQRSTTGSCRSGGLTARSRKAWQLRSLPHDGTAVAGGSEMGPVATAAHDHDHGHSHDGDEHESSSGHGHSHAHGHSHDHHGEAQLLAGIHSHSHSHRTPGAGNFLQRGLDVVFGFLGVTELAAILSESISIVVTAWVLLVS